MPESNPAPTGKPSNTPPPDVRAEQAAHDAHRASADAATSVADAVKRVADAAVAEIQKRPVALGDRPDFLFTAVRGGRFTIDGGNNLGPSGIVKLNGKQLNTRGWSTSYIEGDMPSDANPGDVTVQVDPETTRQGYWRG